jgi:hypothetical protein
MPNRFLNWSRYVLTKISVTIAAGAIVFEALMGIDWFILL